MTSLFQYRPSMFRVIPSHFSSQSFSLVSLVFPTFLVQSFWLFQSDLSIFCGSVHPIFSSQSFIFLSQYLPFFSDHSFPFWGQSSQYFRVGPSYFFESVLRIFLSQMFPFCLADFYLISPSSFYSSWVSLEDVFDWTCQLKLYFLITKLV